MALPLHPKIVHFPIALAVLAPFVSAGLALAWTRGWLPKRSWIVAAALQALIAASAFAAMETGEDDEEVAEAIVSHHAIHEHEEAAEVFAYSTIPLAALGLLALFMGDGRAARGAAWASVVCAAVSAALVVPAAHKGGELVYVHGAATAHGAATSPEAGAGEGAADDGDGPDDH
ncbi:MAG: hypothetical protein H6698_05230 [Myxococcales bacterium]|nr:hypothetical protein [Myxococcales bacterium]MCB9530191.1 hypothetical protein [Myxococcales bacterium]MCB9533704.1 hypothetical protein [Myxococcales bacterium]